MGLVYDRIALPSTTSTPVTKLRMRAFRSGKVPSWRDSRKSATYPLISLQVGSSTRHCSAATRSGTGGEPAKPVDARPARMLDAGQRVRKTRLNPQEPSARQSWRLNHFSGRPGLASSREGSAAPSITTTDCQIWRLILRIRPRARNRGKFMAVRFRSKSVAKITRSDKPSL